MAAHQPQSLYQQAPTHGPGPLTEGLAAIFGDAGLGSWRDPSQSIPAHLPVQPATPPVSTGLRQPAFAQQPAMPAAPANPPTGSLAGISATALMNALQQRPESEAMDATSLDTLRMQLFGRYYQELEGRMKELRSVVEGGMARGRRSLTERMDELGAGLHRDMVAMRQEMQKELEDLKRDVFSAVMSLSALNDKLGLTDSRFRETWMAVMKSLTDRIDNQAGHLNDSVKGLETKVESLMEERVNGLVEKALIRLAAARRAQQIAASSQPLESSAA